jgi:hypothetical protein
MNRITDITEINIQEKTQRNIELQDVIVMESVGKNVSKTSSAEQLQSRLEREKLD